MQESELKNLKTKYLNKAIHITFMVGEPQYSGKIGIVKHIDDIGQLHGTWGGCALIPNEDEFEIIED